MNDSNLNQDLSELAVAEEQAAANWQPAKGADPFATCVDRRTFLRGGAALFGGAALSVPLQAFMARRAVAGPIASPYGPIAPVADQSTGLSLIQLPAGFSYWSFGWTGDPLSDGTPTPALHDGMAVVREVGNKGKRLILCRNHEVGSNIPAFYNGPITYSPNAGGGNTNFVFNTQTLEVEESWASLAGTVRNCAGGVTPWGTWLSCEESMDITTDSATGATFKHGYCFDIPANGRGRKNSIPLVEMGRFSHEAVCVDPCSGIIYETEDGPSWDDSAGSGFYRFLPNRYGNLYRGGTLEMLRVVGQPRKNMQPIATSDAVTEFDCEWVSVDSPDPDVEGGAASCFKQGFDLGGASFRRLEGCWFGDGKVYFVSTDGGPIADGSTRGEGQVWEYNPTTEKLRIIYHSENINDCENPDNLVVTPRGALILCEDNSGSALAGRANPGERLLGLTLRGEIFTFALNNMNFTAAGIGSYTRPESGLTFSGDQRQNEWAGACWSGDGEWLFVNIQTPGLTFAITGPWANGPF